MFRITIFSSFYGLTYSTFEYTDLVPGSRTMPLGGSIPVTVTLTNTGSREATEVVQLYTRDVAGSIARPVRELKDFRRVTLEAGESAQVEFTLTSDQLAFYGIDGTRRTEPGEFRVWVGPNSAEGLEAQFVLE